MSNEFKIESEKDETLCVYKTTDYDAFNEILGNRYVNRGNVNKIKTSMEIEHLKVPAIINEFGEVCDGQHRLTACKELGIPFYYIIIDGYRLKEVQKINANQKNWSDGDYLNSFVKRHEHDGGFDDYVIFKKTLKKTKISGIPSLITIITGGCTNDSLQNWFRGGRMTAIDWNMTNEIIDELTAFEEIFPKKWAQKHFTSVYMAMRNADNFSITHFLNMCDRHKVGAQQVEDAGNKDRLLTLMVGLYNNLDKGVARSKTIYAEDIRNDVKDTFSIQW